MGIKFWICISLLFVAFVAMILNKKIRCLQLLKDFIHIFYDNRTNKVSVFDIVSFFVCPIVVAVAIVVGFDYYFSSVVSNALLTIFSILFTLLFGVMSLLTSSLNSVDSTKKKISNEAFIAVSFSMFSSLTLLMITIIYIALLEKNGSTLCFQILSGTIIAITCNMFMLFYMIIKRSYVTSTK